MCLQTCSMHGASREGQIQGAWKCRLNPLPFPEGPSAFCLSHMCLIHDDKDRVALLVRASCSLSIPFSSSSQVCAGHGERSQI